MAHQTVNRTADDKMADDVVMLGSLFYRKVRQIGLQENSDISLTKTKIKTIIICIFVHENWNENENYFRNEN